MLCISFTSRLVEAGEDGINGIDGVDGKDGINGTNGQDGQDGADCVGFDELTQYGYINLEIEGIRSDNQAFQDTTSFKFTPIELDGYSKVTTADDILYTFEIRGYLSAPDDVYQNSYIYLSLVLLNFQEEGMEISFETFGSSQNPVVGEDHKYFILNANAINPINFESIVENFTFDSSDRNHAKYSYSIVIPAEDNSSGHELQVSGEVDVHLLEEFRFVYSKFNFS